jgi:hypothetical protein
MVRNHKHVYTFLYENCCVGYVGCSSIVEETYEVFSECDASSFKL